MKSFTIKNAINTCYMDSILMSLFYPPSNICKLLLQVEPEKLDVIYLQEILRDDFIKKVSMLESIDYQSIETIRMLCFDLGWRDGNKQEYYAQQDVSEFYEFLINLMNPSQFLIEIQRSTFEDITMDKHGSIEKIPFIPLSPTFNPINNSNVHKTQFNVSDMLNDWMFDNVFKKNCGKTIINNYNILNTPYILPFVINRYTCENNKLNVDINVEKVILPFKHMNKNLSWTIHAIICHNGVNTKSGHYYTILCNNDKWYLFDDLKTPSLKEISIKDYDIDEKIKKQSVFLLYKLKL